MNPEEAELELSDAVEAGWPSERLLVDVFPSTSPVEALYEIRELVDLHELNVFSLGPPLRVQVPMSDMINIIDQLSFHRLRIVHWPFTIDRP